MPTKWVFFYTQSFARTRILYTAFGCLSRIDKLTFPGMSIDCKQREMAAVLFFCLQRLQSIDNENNFNPGTIGHHRRQGAHKKGDKSSQSITTFFT